MNEAIKDNVAGAATPAIPQFLKRESKSQTTKVSQEGVQGDDSAPVVSK